MRDYQTKVNVGGGPDSITNTKFGGGEFNSLAVENENAVLRSGQTLAPADGTGEVSTQLAQSLFMHGTKASSFQAAGTVDAITLTPISGASGVVIPADYDNIEGAKINFIPTGANTGNVTISIGQTGGTQLGTKKALDEVGAELAAGTLSATRFEFVYDPTADSSNGAWILTPWSSSVATSGLVLLATATASNSTSIDFTSFIDSTYEEYEIHCINVVPSVDQRALWLRVSDDGGSTFKSGASDYSRVSVGNSAGATSPTGAGTAGDVKILLSSTGGIGNGSNEQVNSIITISNPADSSLSTTVIYKTIEDHFTLGLTSNFGGGRYNTAATIDALRILMSADNIASGEFKLYGVKK